MFGEGHVDDVTHLTEDQLAEATSIDNRRNAQAELGHPPSVEELIAHYSSHVHPAAIPSIPLHGSGEPCISDKL